MNGAAYFQLLARYNAWANGLLYEAVAGLTEEERRQDRQAFFTSIHGTLNHTIVADRIWLKRLTGDGPDYDRLDLEPYDRFDMICAARRDEDQRLISLMRYYDDAAIAGPFEWRNMPGHAMTAPLAHVLAHVFNHQTHHRGQIHTMISQTGRKPPQLDLIYFPETYVFPSHEQRS